MTAIQPNVHLFAELVAIVEKTVTASSVSIYRQILNLYEQITGYHTSTCCQKEQAF